MEKMTVEQFSEALESRQGFTFSELARAENIQPQRAPRDLRRILERVLRLDRMLRSVGWKITIEKQEP